MKGLIPTGQVLIRNLLNGKNPFASPSRPVQYPPIKQRSRRLKGKKK